MPFTLEQQKDFVKKTITIPDIEIFKTGTHNGDTYTVDDLRQMIAASTQVGFDPPVKLGHMGEKDTEALLKKEGLPAVGYVKNLRVKGQKLIADFTEVPKRLGELIKTGRWKRVSAEIYWNYKKESDIFPRVLKAVALLGAEIPAITDLASIEALYQTQHDDQGNEFRTYFGFDDGPYSGVKLSKDDEAVAYRLAIGTLEQCRTCRFFLGPREIGFVGGCVLVQGEISADFVCSLFRASDAFVSTVGEDTIDAETILEAVFGSDEMAVIVEKDFEIVKKGDKYCLIAKDTGKELGCHDTREGAQKQEAAIKARQEKSVQSKKLQEPVKQPASHRTDDGTTNGGVDPNEEEKMTQQVVELEEQKKEILEQKKQIGELTRRLDDKEKEPEKVTTLTKDLEASNARLVKMEKDRDEDRMRAWIKEMKAQGRVVPVFEEKLLKILVNASTEKVIEFTEKGETRSLSMRELVQGMTESLPQVVEFDELSEGQGPERPTGASYKSVSDEVDRRAKKYQADHPQTTYEGAVDIVLDQDPQLKKQYAGL